MKDKLQEPSILKFVLGCDIIWLLETKKYFQLNVPGFSVYTNVSRSGPHRGGVVMLIARWLTEYVSRVDTDVEGQIWLQLSWWPNVNLGGVYIPPEDSPYYHASQFGEVAARTRGSEKVVVMGDFNARVGDPIIRDEMGNLYEYQEVKDRTKNDHGKILVNVCNNNKMVIANHLRTGTKVVGGDLSFRRKEEWISEIDLCVVKENSVDLIEGLVVNQEVGRSDHAPLSVTLNLDSGVCASARELLVRSAGLGDSCQHQSQHKLRKSVCHKRVDLESMANELNSLAPPQVNRTEDVEAVLEAGYSTIMECARRHTVRCSDSTHTWDETQPRWKRLLDENDCKTIWKSINWKGEVHYEDMEKPTEHQFQQHFEKLLNPLSEQSISSSMPQDDDLENMPYIPILDDPFSATELDNALHVTKNKSYTGICPAMIKVFDVSWRLFILNVFNVVFTQICYPLLWCYNKLVVLYKSGNRMSCGNYRGITIMDTLAKVYDTMILNRLKLWWSIDKCQAGAQKQRGCVEQITALRLLCDYVMYKKRKLYVLFIDFSKAYDRVPRGKLVDILKDLGCGKVMIKAIKAMYTCTRNIMKSAIIESSIGVRQGAPTSCLLFTLYIDHMVKMLKNEIGADDFLGSLHTMLLMDDAVIVATSREMCERKMNIVLRYCSEYGMLINQKKTKFFVVNGDDRDKQDLRVGEVMVSYAARYLYLGAWFTDTAKMVDVLNMHQTMSEATVNKFSIFCTANTSMPFTFKKKVFDAAVTSALLYSCESWLTNKVKSVERQYNSLVKCLLGVRKNTSINLCMVESGILPVIDLVKRRRKKFLKSKLESIDMEQPFSIVYDLCRRENTPGYRFLNRELLVVLDNDPLERVRSMLRNTPSSATKINTYINDFNPTLTVHNVYTTNDYVPDYQREAFTRLRLMSHNLRIETGRWSRTPTEQRVCLCDGVHVQTEQHVLLECSLTVQLRNRYQMLRFGNFKEIMEETVHTQELCKYIFEALNMYM